MKTDLKHIYGGGGYSHIVAGVLKPRISKFTNFEESFKKALFKSYDISNHLLLHRKSSLQEQADYFQTKLGCHHHYISKMYLFYELSSKCSNFEMRGFNTPVTICRISVPDH